VHVIELIIAVLIYAFIAVVLGLLISVKAWFFVAVLGAAAVLVALMLGLTWKIGGKGGES